MEGPITSILNTTKKLIPPRCALDILITNAPSKFAIHAARDDVNYFIELDSLQLQVRRHILAPDLSLQIEDRLNKGQPFNYYVSRLAVAGPYQALAGRMAFSTQLSMSRRCSKLLVFMVESDASEDFRKNPLYFQSFGLQQIQAIFEVKDFEFD